LRLGEMHGKLGLLKIMLAQAQRMLGLVRGNDGDGTANTALQVAPRRALNRDLNEPRLSLMLRGVWLA